MYVPLPLASARIAMWTQEFLKRIFTGQFVRILLMTQEVVEEFLK